MESRFFRYVNKHGPFSVHVPNLGRCWIWEGGTNGFYGMFSIKIDGRWRNRGAHKISWELFNKATVLKGFFVDHMCRNKLCVNPRHLQIVTPLESQHVSTDKTTATKTHCKHGHSLKDARLVHRSNGYVTRVCRVCDAKRIEVHLFKKYGMIKGVNRSLVATKDKAKEIRKIYSEGNLSQQQIGDMFGISNQTVSNIVLNRIVAYA